MTSPHWQTGLQNRHVMHLAHLVKQVSVDYDQDIVHCLVKQARDHLCLNKTLPNI